MYNKKEIIRGIKFVLFSASAGIIEFVSFALLDGLTQWHYWPKYLIALILSVLWNFYAEQALYLPFRRKCSD